MKGARAQLLCTAQLAGEQLQRNQPIGGLSEELCTKKLRCLRRTYFFITHLVSPGIKASEAGIDHIGKDLLKESPAHQASCNREYKTGPQDL